MVIMIYYVGYCYRNLVSRSRIKLLPYEIGPTVSRLMLNLSTVIVTVSLGGLSLHVKDVHLRLILSYILISGSFFSSNAYWWLVRVACQLFLRCCRPMWKRSSHIEEEIWCTSVFECNICIWSKWQRRDISGVLLYLAKGVLNGVHN